MKKGVRAKHETIVSSSFLDINVRIFIASAMAAMIIFLVHEALDVYKLFTF